VSAGDKSLNPPMLRVQYRHHKQLHRGAKKKQICRQ